MTIYTSFDVFFSLGGTEALTELAACACRISPSLLGFYETYEIPQKNNKKGKTVKITLKWSIKIIMATFHCTKGMWQQEKHQYLCQTCLLFASSRAAGEVRRQCLRKLIHSHQLLGKKMQTRLWLWKFKYQKLALKDEFMLTHKMNS